ncbi:MAG: HisA/HisF-related TIM barrel protein [Patescibacteria group bacterium]
MKLREIDFGSIFCASCTRNVSGEGWRLTRPFLNWTGSTLITKTVTLEPRAGNMPLDENWQPWEIFPSCIKTFFLQGAALNALGLSGPGIKAILASGVWQKIDEPFIISFMPLGATVYERLAETREFVKILRAQLSSFKAQGKIALEINLSCPNVHSGFLGAESSKFVDEACDILKEANILEIPLIIKINALVPPSIANLIAKHPSCDALDISNTIPFGAETDPPIPWWRYSSWWTLKGLFGLKSPLYYRRFNKGREEKEKQPGGLSGRPLYRVIFKWVEDFRRLNGETSLIVGGGIFSVEDATYLLKLDADAISLGTVAMIRPWRVQGIIKAVNKYFETKKR